MFTSIEHPILSASNNNFSIANATAFPFTEIIGLSATISLAITSLEAIKAASTVFSPRR
ncbi:MAG: Uncharacterised protein [Methanobacteriota archaeon]|nr:MAG: Uncharacterised protein [Euryarchaeota archaeon]